MRARRRPVFRDNHTLILFVRAGLLALGSLKGGAFSAATAINEAKLAVSTLVFRSLLLYEFDYLR